MNKVLILGAGLVARPLVEYLMSHGFRVVIASPMKGRAEEMIAGNPLGSAVDWSMDDPETLGMLVAGNDITVSLLPYVFHPDVARICLDCRRHLVTTSYIRKEMEALHEPAVQAGVLFLNEAGLDPGIDHMSAMKMIDMIHSNGGRVEEFYSICGALPAPEAADNPMKYKFSWSPRGVITASLNDAVFLKNGNRIEISSDRLFKNTFMRNIQGVGELEVYPNRDSLSYASIYGIPEAITMFRGTFRYKGWCETIDVFRQLNLFDTGVRDYTGYSYSGFLGERSGLEGDLRDAVIKKFGLEASSPPIEALEFLGLFSNENMKYRETTPFEITSDLMIGKMMLGENERDMVVLHHIFLAAWANGKKEVIRSSMIDFGSPSANSSVARTVALPAAIIVRMVLEGRLDLKGVHRPVMPEIYNPVLDELRTLGISIKDEYWLPEEELPTPLRS